MSDDEFDDDEPELDDDELVGDEIVDDLALDEDLPTEVVVVEPEDLVLDADVPVEAEVEADVVVEKVTPRPRSRAKARAKSDTEDEEEDVVDLEEELHPDDVEEPLDVLLAERTASGTLGDEEEAVEEEEVEVDDRAEGTTRIVPRRANEFLCQSCFLVLPMNQLADPKRMLCRDCV